MRKINFLTLCVFLFFYFQKLNAQVNYTSLDSSQPIQFLGDRVIFNDEEIVLGAKTFFVDAQLSDEKIASSSYVFNDFNEASLHFTDGTESEPMRVYIAPYVYWIDDPDDPTIRVGKDGREPFGLVVKCANLHIIGLNSNPKNVILASNRGQTQGAIGNFTMFDFWGDGLVVKNLTLGNYCNVDLEYSLNPKLGRKKRMSATTQAHLAYCHGDKILAENVHFISRLNMNPLNGARRILFNECYMECTDDALTGTGVYLNCSLSLYGQKPFWRSDMGGAIFLNCDFFIKHENNRQYFCKSVGPLSLIDCRFQTNKDVYIGWTQTPTDWLRCYQYNVTLNNEPYIIGNEKLYNTIALDSLNLLNAYRIEVDGKEVYNTYNLLRGEDDWDPLATKKIIGNQEKQQKKNLSCIGTNLAIEPLTASIQTGNQPLKLTATIKRHCNFEMKDSSVKWKVSSGDEKEVQLTILNDRECIIDALNSSDETKLISVIAYTDDGLECGTEITVIPNYLEAPSFITPPTLRISKGLATVDYLLDLKERKDQSLITWYRCDNSKGINKTPVAVSRLNSPKYTYSLKKEDVGYYIIAVVEPKHIRSLPGESKMIVSKSSIKENQVYHTGILETDFKDFPTSNQTLLIPGFWTVDGYKPSDTAEYDWEVFPDKDYWVYGKGINGSLGSGLLQIQRGARMLYTPLDANYGDMEVLLNVDPSKTAGQGFGSATGQYLDVYIKFDTYTLTGYALRIIRTTKYSNAVDFVLMQYDNGKTKAISEPVSSVCYRTDCTIKLKIEENKFTACAETTTPVTIPPAHPELKEKVFLEADVAANGFGGTGIQHTGTCGESATMLHSLKVEWE